MGRLKLSKGVKFQDLRFSMGGWLDRLGYFKGVENFSDGVFFEKSRIFQVKGLMLFHNG